MIGFQRIAGCVTTQFFRRAAYSSSTRIAAAVSAASRSNAGEESTGTTTALNEESTATKKPRGALVAAAFESLKNDESTSTTGAGKTSTATAKFTSINIDERIVGAKNVNALLSITEIGDTFSRQHALKIVSILAEWSSLNRVKISEFENDTRFLRICRMLGRTVPKNGGKPSSENNNSTNSKRISGFRTDDLNTVLGVAGDDEAAKLIASISLPQMVKVMSALAQKKRRSTPLLRSLAFNISSATEQLDLKQCGDILYAMATLNFQDSVLGAKVCADVQTALPSNTERSAVVGSILTSLGILRYRDLDVLEALTQWLLKNNEVCRPQDLNAYFYSAALLNFKSGNLEDVRSSLVKSIVREDYTKSIDWLNYVWSLTLLGLVNNSQLESVLRPEFVQKLETEKSLMPTSKMKLLNLNKYAQLLSEGYKSALLPDESVVYDVPMAHSKSKQILLNGVLDALKSLLPANNVKNSVDSKMGFLIDAFCYFDAKRNPLPLDKEHRNAIKVALMIVDFHDICHGTHRSSNGITSLTFDLLEKSGYKVIPIPYNEFSTSDKLLKRVQYLEAKFKSVITSK